MGHSVGRAPLIYITNASLDGYIEETKPAPSIGSNPAQIAELLRPIGSSELILRAEPIYWFICPTGST